MCSSDLPGPRPGSIDKQHDYTSYISNSIVFATKKTLLSITCKKIILDYYDALHSKIVILTGIFIHHLFWFGITDCIKATYYIIWQNIDYSVAIFISRYHGHILTRQSIRLEMHVLKIWLKIKKIKFDQINRNEQKQLQYE